MKWASSHDMEAASQGLAQEMVKAMRLEVQEVSKTVGTTVGRGHVTRIVAVGKNGTVNLGLRTRLKTGDAGMCRL